MDHVRRLPEFSVSAAAPAFGMHVFRQATLNSVPNKLLECSRIDGCGELRIFFAIVLPLVGPMIGATYQSPEKFPLAVAIAQLKGVYAQDYGMLMAATLVSVAPSSACFCCCKASSFPA